MHALCSPFNIMQYRKTLWTMINGYLPPASWTVHLLEKTWRRCLSKMILFYWVFWDLGCLAVALNSYSPNLEKNGTVQHGYASHIFTNCHKNNKQRTHIASGKSMHTKILFPLKIHGRPSALVSRLLSVVFAMLSTATYLGLGYRDTVSTDGRQLVSYRSQVTKPIRITRRNLV